MAALVDLVESNGFAGIDLDYEQFAFSDGGAPWAGTRLVWCSSWPTWAPPCTRAKLLTVTTPPIYDSKRTADSGYWVYDWAGIAARRPAADHGVRVQLLECRADGAHLRVEQIVAHAVKVVPPAKVQIGVPAYGRDFVTGVTGPALAVSTPHGPTSATVGSPPSCRRRGRPGPGRAVRRDDVLLRGHVHRPGPGRALGRGDLPGRPHRGAPDVESMLAEARLVGAYGISGIAQWALGFEDPAQWQPLRDYAGSLPHPGGTDPTGAVEVVEAGAGQVIVGGWALDPESDLPIQVAVTTAAGQAVFLANGGRPDIAQSYPGAGPFHGFGYRVAAPSGRRASVCRRSAWAPAPARPRSAARASPSPEASALDREQTPPRRPWTHPVHGRRHRDLCGEIGP